MRLPAALTGLALLGLSHAATAAEARTVEFTQQVANPMAGQCPQRTAHYSIADAGAGKGMLSIASQWHCGSSSGSGSVGVCQLDATLRCRSDVQFKDRNGNPIDLSGYAVGATGVTAKGELHPWVDPAGAAAIIQVIGSAAAQQASQNQAALGKLGGEENFRQMLTASGCRYALVRAGVLPPTPKEQAEDEQNRRNGVKVTVDTSPGHLATCRTTIATFCARRDLPATLTQQDYYRTVCGGPRP
ncbi:MAG TPA: hypothetical protein VMU44_06360 [Steroidobacteraceae bacterium]|nr:hypothetical protein [Steroidobacteraceae bacterium]